MNLHEIIKANECHTTSILIEEIVKYKRSLLTCYTDLFCCEPILMVTDVMNAAQYGKIVPMNEFEEAILAYLEIDHVDYSADGESAEWENVCAHETIVFNSMSLDKL